MVTTRSQGMTIPDRSLLQLQRDLVGSGMRFDWPGVGARPNEDSRGIVNTNVLCYQSSVLQTFMHQPPFLRWIMTHNTAEAICPDDECLKCFVKQLAEEYWGPQDPTNNPIPSQDDPAYIAAISLNSGLFMAFAQDDAVLFYSWLTDQLRAQPPNTFSPQWQAEFDALYRPDLHLTDTCNTCGATSHPPPETSRHIALGVHAADTTIYDPMTTIFTETVNGIRCTVCCGRDDRVSKNRTKTIAAAPKILFLTLNIILPTGKIMHALRYPEILDLTARQQNPTLPLHYRLAGVVAHAGASALGGHFVASVRGRVPGTFSCISDSLREDFGLQQFLANPQDPQTPGVWDGRGYQVYMLCYVREDEARRMPVRPRVGGRRGRRLEREMRRLM